jgi:hypothetical protein
MPITGWHSVRRSPQRCAADGRRAGWSKSRQALQPPAAEPEQADHHGQHSWPGASYASRTRRLAEDEHPEHERPEDDHGAASLGVRAVGLDAQAHRRPVANRGRQLDNSSLVRDERVIARRAQRRRDLRRIVQLGGELADGQSADWRPRHDDSRATSGLIAAGQVRTVAAIVPMIRARR